MDLSLNLSVTLSLLYQHFYAVCVKRTRVPIGPDICLRQLLCKSASAAMSHASLSTLFFPLHIQLTFPLPSPFFPSHSFYSLNHTINSRIMHKMAILVISIICVLFALPQVVLGEDLSYCGIAGCGANCVNDYCACKCTSKQHAALLLLAAKGSCRYFANDHVHLLLLICLPIDGDVTPKRSLRQTVSDSA